MKKENGKTRKRMKTRKRENEKTKHETQNTKHAIRIVHVATREVSVEKLLKNKLKLLRDEGHEVYAVASGNHYVNAITSEGIQYKHIPMSYRINPIMDMLSFLLMTWYFRKERFNLVHTHTAKAGIIGRISARLAGIPIVLHSYHGIPFYEGQNRLLKYIYSRIEKFVGRITDMAFSQNQGDIDELVFNNVLPEEKILYEGNGVDIGRLDALRNEANVHKIKQQLSIGEGVPVIGCFARLEPVKGHAFLFKAFEKLLRVQPDIICLLAGDGPLKKDLESLAFKLGIHRNIRFLGWREDIQHLHALIDLLVLPSKKEGIPRTVMEAMAASNPVVATDVPGTREIVKDQHTGILVPYGDEQAMCDAISKIIKDREKANRYGVNGRARIEGEFDERLVTKRILKAYTNLTLRFAQGQAYQKGMFPKLVEAVPAIPVKRLKIAHVATLDMSVRFLLLNQLLRLKAQGYDVHAVCGPGEWISEIESYGITVHTVKMHRAVSPFHDSLALWKLFECLKREEFDLVNTHTPKAGILGPIAAKLAGVPIIIHTVHGFLFHDNVPIPKRFIFMGAEKLTATFADYLFSQSSEDIEQAIKHKISLPENIFYIGNGIDVTRFNPHNISIPPQKKREEVGIKADELVVGIVARLVYEKGYMELFQAAVELTRKFDNVKFLVVGPVENERKDAVNLELLEELGIEESVIFLGMRKDVPELYSIMDIFVLPSWREGIPRALMEAMAMGVPVVATNIRGCREVVKNGETGLLVPVRNHQALAEATAILLQDKQKRIEMGKAGRQYILTNFTEDAVYQRIIQLYDVVTAVNGFLKRIKRIS